MEGCHHHFACMSNFACCGAEHIRENLGSLTLQCADCDQEILSLEFYKDRETNFIPSSPSMEDSLGTVGYDGEIKHCQCNVRSGLRYQHQCGDAWKIAGYKSDWVNTPLGQIEVSWDSNKNVTINFGIPWKLDDTDLVFNLEGNFMFDALFINPGAAQ